MIPAELAKHVWWLVRAGLLVAGPLSRAQQAVPAGGVKFPEVTDVDHAALIRAWDGQAFERGKTLYHTVCFACHGTDGRKVTVQGARAFAVDPLVHPTDPYGLFKTISFGFNTMPQQQWMTPAQRYDVVHYIREAFLRESNPSQYVKVDEAYLEKLPKPAPGVVGEKKRETDHGPVLCSNLGREFPLVLSHRLPGELRVSYDLLRMRLAGVSSGGFLDLDETRFTRQRGEQPVRPLGRPVAGLGVWKWAWGGSFDHGELPPRSPAPPEQMQFLGHYLHGERAVMAYRVAGTKVLEMPAAEMDGESLVLSHTLHLDASRETLELCVAELDEAGPVAGVMAVGGGTGGKEANSAVGTLAVVSAVKEPVSSGAFGFHVAAAVVGDAAGLLWRVDEGRRLVLEIAPSEKPRMIEVLRHAGGGPGSLSQFSDHALRRQRGGAVIDLSGLTAGGPNRFPQPITVKGKLGEDFNGYALDTIPLPDDNPYGAWLRTSALGFFDDGRCAVSTYTGDIWIASGIDRGLEHVTWQRFASGLYEPFGLLVIDGLVHVTCRDGIKRLHDLNDDGYADYYETFFADPDVSSFFHAFCFDLQRDSKGNLYYAKSGQYTDFKQPGAVVQVAPDGRSFEYYASGFRTPNGMGMMPGDLPLCSDNQGNWIPASKISLCRKGGFHGYVQTHAAGEWAPDGGRIDHTKVRRPASYDQPILWLPVSEDNSSGSQLWVDDPRFGPLKGTAGRLMHSSFGKGWVYYLMLQEIDGTTQAACVTLPHQWAAGVQRLRSNPADGQLYGVGISGWQGPQGGKDGCLQRLRHSGGECRIIDDVRTTAEGIELRFNFELDGEAAADPEAYHLEMWNYEWHPEYGSKFYSVRRPGEQGTDKLVVTAVRVAADRRRVDLVIKDFVRCDQLRAEIQLRGSDGREFKQRFYQTIHKLPER